MWAPASTRNCWPPGRRLKPLIVEKCPFAERPKPDRGITWVKPELVCQVKYANWTPDRRLRAPVFLGLRDDKAARRGGRAKIAGANCLPTAPRRPPCEIDGHTLKFTNLSKVFYPDEGYTKRDVLNYYDRVADLIVPHLRDRPLSLKRYPDGIQKEFFFQKNVRQNLARGCVPNRSNPGTRPSPSLIVSRRTAPACCTW